MRSAPRSQAKQQQATLDARVHTCPNQNHPDKLACKLQAHAKIFNKKKRFVECVPIGVGSRFYDTHVRNVYLSLKGGLHKGISGDSLFQLKMRLFWSHFQTLHCLKIIQNVAFEFLEFWHFPPIFFLLKLTCLVTLFDRKLQVFKNSP